MITIYQGDFTVTIYLLKMRGSIQELGLAKRRAAQLKPEKIRIDELSSQQEKLHTEALLEVLGKYITDEIYATLKTTSEPAMNQQCKFTPVT